MEPLNFSDLTSTELSICYAILMAVFLVIAGLVLAYTLRDEEDDDDEYDYNDH